jgi:asparagine synthase (glutamine-hydrolysing)
LIVPHLYEEFDVESLCNMLSGKFGGIIYDVIQDRWFIFRDHMGINPVYIGRGNEGEFFVASEMKAFSDMANNIEIVLPGTKYNF